MSKLGDVYVEIGLRADGLKSGLRTSESEVKNTAKKFEDYFRNLKMDIDNRLMVTKFNDLKGLARALQVQLEQKIKLNADVASIEKTRIALDSVRGSMGRLSGTTHSYNMIGMNFNRILQDSPYFMQSLQLGIMATANNFQEFATSVALGKARGESFMTMIKSSITGVNGYILALNLVISVILAFSLSQRNAKEDVSKTTDELKNQEEVIKRMSGIVLNDAIFKLEQEIDLLKQKAEAEKKAADAGAQSFAVTPYGVMATPASKKGFVFSQQEELTKQSKLLDMYNAQLVSLGGIENVRNRIKELEEAKAKVVGDANNKEAQQQRDNYTYQINSLKKSLDLMDLKEAKQKKGLITTDAELQKEIQLIQAKIQTTKSEREKYLLNEKLVELKDQLYRYEKLESDELERGAKALDEKYSTINKYIEASQRLVDEENFNKKIDTYIGGGSKEAGSGADITNYINESQKGIDEQNKSFDKGITLQQQYFSTMANGFTQAIFGAQTFGQAMIQLVSQMAQMVAQALIFEAIWAVFNPAKESGGLFSGLFQRTSFQTPTYSTPTMSGSEGTSFSFNDSNIVNAINSLNKSGGNQSSPSSFSVMWNNKEIGRLVAKQTYIDSKGNFNNVR